MSYASLHDLQKCFLQKNAPSRVPREYSTIRLTCQRQRANPRGQDNFSCLGFKLLSMRLLLWIRVLLFCGGFCSLANAQQFAFGGSLSGIGTFGTGLLNTGLPGTFGVAARAEWLNAFAPNFSVRADFATRGLEAGVAWRLDLSSEVNLTINIGFMLLEWQETGLYGRFGLEYRFSGFAVALEYGWLSPFVGVLRPSLIFSFLYFLRVS